MDPYASNAIPMEAFLYEDEKGKLFVGGLSWDTTHASLLKYFSQFGEVIDCVVMKNQQTGKSRGFGFVKFKESGVIEAVLLQGPHWLDGRQVDPKMCNPRSLNQGGKSAENSRRKVFVGGLPPSCDEALLKEVFRKFGKVEESTVMYDQEKNRSRGFGFLTFESEESVDRVCGEHYISISGKQVEVKRAEPRQVKSIADTGNIGMIPGAQGMVLGLSPGASGSLVHNLSQGSMNGSPQQLPSAVGASMQHPAYLAGPGVAMLPYNPAFGGAGYYCVHDTLQFHPMGAPALPGLLGVPPGTMAVPAGTGDSVVPKNMHVPTMQMGRGYSHETMTGMTSRHVNGAGIHHGPEPASGAQISFQPNVTYTLATGVQQLQGYGGGPSATGGSTPLGGNGDAPSGTQYIQQIQPSIGRMPTNHTNSILGFHPYRR